MGLQTLTGRGDVSLTQVGTPPLPPEFSWGSPSKPLEQSLPLPTALPTFQRVWHSCAYLFSPLRGQTHT